jgi:hypothetical protein
MAQGPPLEDFSIARKVIRSEAKRFQFKWHWTLLGRWASLDSEKPGCGTTERNEDAIS